MSSGSSNLSLGEPFLPRRGLRGGHAQTMAGYLLRRRISLPAAEERLFQVEPEVQVLCRCHWQREPASTPALLLLHGLQGSSESPYITGAARKALDAGMNVVRMNMRNCGGTERLGPTLYHSGMSADVGAVVRALIAEDRLPRIVIAGFSMGGNLVLKLAGEWGSDAPRELAGVAAVSPAIDLSPSADALHRWDNRLYEWYFLAGLWRSVRRKARLFPDRYRPVKLRALRSIRDFDDCVTAPYGGFRGAEDYYRRASAAPFLHRIAAPALIIHAQDDPFIKLTEETLARLRGNPNITFLPTPGGGHCAFLAPANGYDGRWAERQVVRFATSVSSFQSTATAAGPARETGNP